MDDPAAAALAAWRHLLQSLSAWPYPVLLKDAERRWVYANPAILDLFGLTGMDYVGRRDADLLGPEAAAICGVADHRALARGELSEDIERIGERSFRTFKVPLEEEGKIVGLLTLAPEISDLEAARADADRYLACYQALTEINQLIIHDPDPQRLFSESCAIFARHLGFRLMWIGWVRPAMGKIDIAAHSPAVPGLDMADIHINLDPDRPEGQGPAAQAVRTDHTAIISEVTSRPDLDHWQPYYRRFGVHSIAAFPIRQKGQVVAVMMTYAATAGYFAPSVVRLLEEGAGDIGFALERHEELRQLARRALYDGLTELPNRVLFQDRIQQAILAGARTAEILAVGFLDMDDFKEVNDRFGHGAGDSLLREWAERLRRALREGDTVARLGGDEFGLLLRAESIAVFWPVVARVQSALSGNLRLPDGSELDMSCSLGIAFSPQDGEDAETLMRHADLALYEAKRRGKGVVQVFADALEKERQGLQSLRARLAQALVHGEIHLVFQPVVELPTGELRGFEALSRWHDENGRAVDPERFMMAVESRLPLAIAFSEYVLRQALSAWPQLAAMGHGGYLAVNICAVTFLSEGFLPRLWDLLAEYPDARRHLLIEVTETALLRDIPLARSIIGALEGQGIRVSLDDFGSGYASLRYLQELPVSQIKLDAGFVRALLDNERNLAIVSGVITTARTLGISLVAEGVESEEHGEILQALGCFKAQGFFIGHPMALEEIPAWMAQWKAPEEWAFWAHHPWHVEHRKLFWGALAHQRWLQRLLSGQADREEQAQALAPDGPHRCRFGQWYDSQAAPLQDHPLYQEIGALHEQIHSTMIHFLNSADLNDGRRDAERAGILQLSQTLLRKLWSLTDSTALSFGDDSL
ncbi:MAG: EAL domain-containing protein [Acidithiobacillus sp.]